jgi:hypothetical protein
MYYNLGSHRQDNLMLLRDYLHALGIELTTFMASKGIFLVIVLLTKIASIKENTEPEKTVIGNKSLNYERLNMWAEVIQG